jgi:hypothetical protein
LYCFENFLEHLNMIFTRFSPVFIESWFPTDTFLVVLCLRYKKCEKISSPKLDRASLAWSQRQVNYSNREAPTVELNCVQRSACVRWIYES